MTLRTILRLLIIAVGYLLSAESAVAQLDTARQIVIPQVPMQSTDSSDNEDAPLDIGIDRGLFIQTPDHKLQLRILGSVRYLAVFDGFDLENKQAFSPLEISTETPTSPSPNYFNSLDQSRLGFEATRRTATGDIFIRLEMDFNGPKGFQIRHAYGQYQQFTVGQTWSLFSQIALLPPMVDLDGPLGSITTRTPQIRFTTTDLLDDTKVSFSLEAVEHNYSGIDSVGLSAIQFLPNPAVRFQRSFPWGDAQVSAIVPILAGRYLDDDQIQLRVGFGLLVAAEVPVSAEGRMFGQLSIGRAITEFLGPFRGRGFDIIVEPDSATQAYSPLTVAGFVTYQHTWQEWLMSNVSAGFATLESRAWVSPSQYQFGYSLQANTFWNVVEGARIGAEVTFGGRVDVSGASGWASRAAALFYYDF